MASESLKLSGISDGNRGDDAAVDRGDFVDDIFKLFIYSAKKHLKSFYFLIHLPPLRHLKKEERN